MSSVRKVAGITRFAPASSPISQASYSPSFSFTKSSFDGRVVERHSVPRTGRP